MSAFTLNATRVPGGAPPRSAPARAFHARLPGFAPTALRPAPALARELGVGAVWLKDETERLGLPAFKVLGAAWAAHRALAELPEGAPPTFVTATDGNHGRAVAHVARLLGASAHVLVPQGIAPARIDAIRAEGARVDVVECGYDEAVERAAALAEGAPGRLLIQDTAWPGYERVPEWIVEGYETIFAELAEQLDAAGARAGLVLLPAGVGSLAAAGVRFLRGSTAHRDAALVSVEPAGAACLLASLRAGEPVDVPGPHPSIMAGLNCGRVSTTAWPALRDGLDAALAIPDAAAQDGMRTLARLGIAAGECAGGVAGAARVLLTGDGAGARRAALRITPDTVVVLPLTEGVTDPDADRGVVG